MSVLALIGLTLAACNTDGASTPSTAPSVVSISPANGERGVLADASIVVTFSKAMDQAATQAAYRSADLSAAAVTFAWNTDSTVLSIQPNAPLAVAHGSSFTLPAKRYEFSLTGTAKDKAGTTLGLTNSGFTTLRNITVVLPSVPALDGEEYREGSSFVTVLNAPVLYVGDTLNNGGILGLLTFDLSAIPADLAATPVGATLKVRKAFVDGDPYTALNPCVPTKTSPCISLFVPVTLEHVNYGTALFPGAAYSTPALHTLGAIDSVSVPQNTEVKASVLVAVQDDLANRVLRESRSQYRLSFPKESDGDSYPDVVAFAAGESGTPPSLAVEYQIP
ncbi:Ig-like domain-containing protein [Deinococcus sp.]|uniref:Ig-like domain-containing protein n=1 Tax=Deinococcus sp. TaxID=47478 RepID=UPI002869CBD6|nr:Ig-like domain-containing protein [Deinococcus sp.]